LSTARQILQQYFGYTDFRPRQEEIITNVLEARDTLVLMPTGGGKSLCYQIPALMMEGLTVVISPLIALMKDQVDALRVNGIPAAFLNSTLSPEEQNTVFSWLEQGRIKLLYLAPERLMHNESAFAGFLKRINVALIAVDEAHCISHWGHDFRPEYRMLGELRRALPEVPFIALTATADELTRRDIAEKLELKNPGIFISSFNRPNIRYSIEPKQQSFERLQAFLAQHREEAGIVYCLSRQNTESLALRLQQLGYQAEAYHAGLDREVRDARQERFLRDETLIMVATIAFGMGINKSNVRYVVHMDLPKNIESYYQETGRAGRDGLPGEALLFYSYADVQKLQRFATIDNNEEQSRIMLKKLDQMAAYCQSTICRRRYLLNYFDEPAPDFCGNCDICLGNYQEIDGTVIAQKALSAVARLNQSFGVAYIIDFLRGSRSARIRESHKTLKTYGAGADISKTQWSAFIADLVALGYLKKSDSEYPVLQLTDKSAAVLHGRERVVLRMTEEAAPAETMPAMEAAGLRRNEKPGGMATAPVYARRLYEILRKLRRNIADAEDVPAFVIFSDATLTELATWMPQHPDELHHISGFGEVKIRKYGKTICNAIQEYCSEHGLSSRISERIQPPSPSRSKSTRGSGSDTKSATLAPGDPTSGGGVASRSDTKSATLALYQDGYSIADIAAMRGLTEIAIEKHLAHFIENGILDISAFVSSEKLDAVRRAAAIYGMKQLSTLKNALGKNFSYTDIRLSLAFMKNDEKE